MWSEEVSKQVKKTIVRLNKKQKSYQRAIKDVGLT